MGEQRLERITTASFAITVVGQQDSHAEPMTVRPLHARIMVQRIDEGEQHVGGIIIPDTAQRSRSRARSSPPAMGR